MSLDPFSVAVGFMSALVLSGVLGAALLVADWWEARKVRDDALDELMSDVAIRCIERPTNVKVN